MTEVHRINSDFDMQMGEIKDRITWRKEPIAMGPEQKPLTQFQADIDGMTSKLVKLAAQRVEILDNPTMKPRLIACVEG